MSEPKLERCPDCQNMVDCREFLRNQRTDGTVGAQCLTCAGLMALNWIDSGCPNCMAAGERIRVVIVAFHQQERRVYSPPVNPESIPPHIPECFWAE